MDENVKSNYLFISYSHRDEGLVMPVLEALKDARVRFWFDDSIEAGEDWPKKVAEKLRDSGTVLIFLSGNAVSSQNCVREINYAVARKKPMICVKLDGAEPPADVAMQLSVVPRIEYTNAAAAADGIRGKLDRSYFGENADNVGPRRRRGGKVNVWAAVSAVLLIAICAMLLAAVGAVRGWIGGEPIVSRTVAEIPGAGEATVTEFGNRLVLEASLRGLDTAAVYLAGNSLVSDATAVIHDENGFFIGDGRLERGFFSDLSHIGNPGKITHLALICESISDLSGIERFEKLEYLDLSGNTLDDLSPLKSLRELKVLKILDLQGNADLSVLCEAESLRQVIISYGMRDRSEELVKAGVEVTIRK